MYLHIVSRYKNGYHKIITLFQSIDLYDVIDLEITNSSLNTTNFETTGYEVPVDDNNTVLKALRLFKQNSGKSFSLCIRLHKNIPTGSGLGGSSSNAATILYMLNKIMKSPFNKEKLTAIAAKIGADVPYFLYGGTAIGLQRGDKIVPLADLELSHILLVLPSLIISTPDIYKAYDKLLTENNIKINIISLKKVASLNELTAVAKNDLEKIVLRDYYQIRKIKEILMSCGASIALLSGSGSSLFGIFKETAQLKKAHSFITEYGIRCQLTRVLTRQEFLMRIDSKVLDRNE